MEAQEPPLQRGGASPGGDQSVGVGREAVEGGGGAGSLGGFCSKCSGRALESLYSGSDRILKNQVWWSWHTGS
jgi:hypothetical protein